MTEHEGPTIGSIQLDLRILGARFCHYGHLWLDEVEIADADDLAEVQTIINRLDQLTKRLEVLTSEASDFCI